MRLGLAFVLALLFGGLVATVVLARPQLASTAPTRASESAPRPTATPLPKPRSLAPSDPEPMRHLPDWVQTRRPDVTLYSGADGDAFRYQSLPAWTFLQVTGVQNDRLRVNFLGNAISGAADANSAGETRNAEARRPAPGWVKLDDVQPSDPGGDWLRTHQASRLDNGVAVPQWSWLLSLDRSRPGQVRVRAYTPDLKSIEGEGWLPATDVGPTGPPDRAVSALASNTTFAPPAAFASKDAFVEAVGAAARELAATTDVPASVTVAQAILESDWGNSLLTRQANNYFGIKAMGRVGSDGAIWMRTQEIGASGPYQVLAPFRAYKSMADSLQDHADLFRRVSLYQRAMQVTDDPDEFARRIAAAGYSTDPAYAQKLIALMQRYNLYRFDA